MIDLPPAAKLLLALAAYTVAVWALMRAWDRLMPREPWEYGE